jgi:uncharacterized protein (TIGR02453 family)
MDEAQAFAGFPAQAIDFYAGLEADNTKAYWTANRAVFDEAVHAPLAALVVELEPRFGPARIMRPYRDVRFTTDKRPYRTSLGAMLRDGYVQISARGLGVGSGAYHLASDQLARYRAAVDDDASGAALEELVDDIEAREIDVAGTDPLRTAPRGYARDHPRIELLRFRGLIAWKGFEIEPWLTTAAAKERVAEVLDATAPLRAWLAAHVGGSAEEPRGRRR